MVQNHGLSITKLPDRCLLLPQNNEKAFNQRVDAFLVATLIDCIDFCIVIKDCSQMLHPVMGLSCGSFSNLSASAARSRCERSERCELEVLLHICAGEMCLIEYKGCQVFAKKN